MPENTGPMSKRLSQVQVNEMRVMVKNGEKPEDIANHFGIAISSVHNYKARFKALGDTVPNLRGQRPSGKVKPVTLQRNVKATTRKNSVKAESKTKSIIGVVTKDKEEAFKFIINGIAVQIAANAKSVNIGKDSVEVNF